MSEPTSILNLQSKAYTASGNNAGLDGGGLPVGACSAIWIDVNVTAVSGSSPTMTLSYERLGADGGWYGVWSSSSITGTGATSIDIGPGMTASKAPGMAGRLVWTLGGTTPSFTFSASIQGN